MKAGLITIFLIFILVASDVRANGIMGSGASSCGEWVVDNDDPLKNKMRLFWVQGYLSGRNATSEEDFLKYYEWKEIYAAIDKYCRENPLRRIFEATEEVIRQMLKVEK